MTPSNILPAIGDLYRGRATGLTGRLLSVGNVYWIDRLDGTRWVGLEVDFWREWIHATARQD